MTTQRVERHVPEWTVADRLRRVRRDTGLKQADFAARLNLGDQRYSAWESGRNQPPMSEFVSVAKRIELAFGVPAEWTLGLEVRGSNGDGPNGGIVNTNGYSSTNPRRSAISAGTYVPTKAAA